MKSNRFFWVAGILSLALQGVANAATPFIENMPALSQDPDRAGAMIWQKADFNRSAYTKVMIEPITIFISPDSDYQGMTADDMKALADKFTTTLIQTLEPEIPVVNESGAGVMYIRVALSNVMLAKKSRGLLSFTPIGLVVTAAQSAVGADISLKNAVLQVEVLDSITGERLGVLTDNAPITADSSLSWDAINQTLAFYADRFKSRMQAK